MLTIYDSISQEKRPFHPLKDNHVRLYACGMTVYDYCHLGHARQMISFDVIVRYLRSRNYIVDFVRNITDIDDKIIQRANENGENIQALTERFIQAMYEDSDALGALRPDKEPKATEHIPHMIEMIETLIQKDFAYVGKNGDVYYKVEAFKSYGKLSHQSIDALQSGVRIDVSESKNSPLDFVLWKIAKLNEPSWDSPWGAGRPGWHIECSAMSTSVLGNHFDLHGGGLDLKFPHHENEIAQSEAATGETFVNTWMHTGLIQVDDEKMSKSLGNFTTVREALEEYHPEVIRYFMVASHYRSPLNYSETNLLAAKSALERLYNTLRDVSIEKEIDDADYEKRFIEKMDDDFNTPEALAILFELSREINRFKSEAPQKVASLGALLKRLSGILGLLQNNPEAFLQSTVSKGLDKTTIEKLIAERNAARAEKNWAEADRIRNDLLKQNVAIEDKNGATTWRYN
jgi:cysteinyl-tRNA synthetase